MANNNSGKNEKDLVCSFCGKHQDEVERMIIGPGVNICSECIGLCHDLLSDKPDQPKSRQADRRRRMEEARVQEQQRKQEEQKKKTLREKQQAAQEAKAAKAARAAVSTTEAGRVGGKSMF